jgi:hypothetical protein
MAGMVGRTLTGTNESLTLWRGESLRKSRARRRRGLILQERWRSRTELWGMYPELASRNPATVLEGLVDLVRGHVRQQDLMPFFSFTSDRCVAERYALTTYNGHTTRRRSCGLLLRMPVLFVAEYRDTFRERDGSAGTLSRRQPGAILGGGARVRKRRALGGAGRRPLR